MTSLNEIFDRDAIDIDAVFTDPDTLLAGDPDEVHFHWKGPDGVLETRQYGAGGSPAVAKIATGHYRVTVDLAGQSGAWSYLVYGVGTLQRSFKGRFLAQESSL